jgi:hypothetical protein
MKPFACAPEMPPAPISPTRTTPFTFDAMVVSILSRGQTAPESTTVSRRAQARATRWRSARRASILVSDDVQ